jgi:hypothetical protein
MPDTAPAFKVLGVRAVLPRPDGTLRRSSHVVDVEVDGVAHEIRIRRSNGAAHLPQALIGNPLGPAIKGAASKALRALLLPRIEAELARRR